MSKNYKPHLFKNKQALNKFLRRKTIVNQSKLLLSDEQIEILALGIKFVPDKSNDTETRVKSLQKFIKQVNTTLYFSDIKNSLRKKGHLSKILKSTWPTPSFSWTRDVSIKKLLNTYIHHEITPKTQFHPCLKEAIQQLNNHPSTYVLPADKGGGVVLWNKEDYIRE